ncbi:hypothetical protein [Leptospira ilyithenensis]|uniref:Lipoprotein n=1 Tax=Leptospira ilyithenensis TaxID=2484901 RepID=A0A4R9LM41_9LEPT|nr:hypothetical protein [Leptospira ilyithenensis]TGN09388.1 hypothetical protein EHS11_12630 [Leptospira ilyithenensis]
MKVANFPANSLQVEYGLIFILLFLSFGFGCSLLKIGNPCDPSSENYNLTLITKSILQDTTANCGVGSSGTKTNSISSFLFDNTMNGLSKTYTGTISGNAIIVSLPYAVREKSERLVGNLHPCA